MANKLYSLIEQWFGDILSKNVSNSAIDAIQNSGIDQFDKDISSLASAIALAKKNVRDLTAAHGANDTATRNAKKALEDLNDDLDDKTKEREKLLKNLSTQTNISIADLQNYIDSITAHGVAATRSAAGTQQFTEVMTRVTGKLGVDFKSLSLELFSLAGVIEQTVEQMVRSNKYLVEASRKTGGTINYKNLGFDAYGSNLTNTGSLSSIAGMNNISEDDFLQSLSGFSKGNVAGQDLSKSADDLQRFGVAQGKLMKLYGVSVGDLEKITELSTQLYGKSIKNLNSEFESGAKTARVAGLNVQEYFKNLARAVDLVGEAYVKGGTEGAEKLAMFATKFNTSVDSLVKFGDGFQTITDIYEKQATATALGLMNYANQSAKIFAQYQLGDVKGGAATSIAALAKDLQKYTDRDGLIDNRGKRALNQLGIDKDQIQLIQRTMQAQKKLNVSFEELADVSKLSAEKQFDYYQEMNRSATITEKLNILWATLKASVLDPIASVLGPALEIVINALVVTFKLLYIILKPVIYGFTVIGKSLSTISNAIAGVAGMIEDFTSKLGISSNKTWESFNKIINVVGTVIAGFLVLKGITYALSAAQALTLRGANSSLLGNLPKIGSSLAGAGGFLGRAGGFIGKIAPRAATGAGIGLLGGLAGDAIAGMGAEGSGVNRLGNAISGAATGAGIGMLAGPWGALAGGIVGGIVGAFKPKEILGFFESIIEWGEKTFGKLIWLIPIFNQLEAVKKIWEWFTHKEPEKDNKDDLKIQTQRFDADYYNKINTALKSRTVEQFTAEKAQAQRLQNTVINIKPTIQTDLMGGAKLKLQGS